MSGNSLKNQHKFSYGLGFSFHGYQTPKKYAFHPSVNPMGTNGGQLAKNRRNGMAQKGGTDVMAGAWASIPFRVVSEWFQSGFRPLSLSPYTFHQPEIQKKLKFHLCREQPSKNLIYISYNTFTPTYIHTYIHIFIYVHTYIYICIDIFVTRHLLPDV